MYHTCVTGRKMCHLHEKNRSVLVKWVTFGKMRTIKQLFWENGHFLKNGLNLEKWVIFGKMGHTRRNGSRLQKWVTLEKNGSDFDDMGHT